MTGLPPAAQRVADALAALGAPAEVRIMPASTRTAEEAAAACGCPRGAIVKSMIFRGAESGGAVLVLTSGANRVNEKRLGWSLGERLSRPDAAFVREATGFAIGGVAPVGHASPMRVVMDRDLFAFATVWSAAGTPHSVFPMAPERLAEITGAQVLAVI